jgi:hypothetical protein
MDAPRAMGRTADDVETASGETPQALAGASRSGRVCADTGPRYGNANSPAGLDPIVAEIIEALARTIIRDEDRRASLPLMNKNE